MQREHPEGVSAGTARAHADANSGLTVLQFDAHADLRDEYMGTKFSHACTASINCSSVHVNGKFVGRSNFGTIAKATTFPITPLYAVESQKETPCGAPTERFTHLDTSAGWRVRVIDNQVSTRST